MIAQTFGLFFKVTVLVAVEGEHNLPTINSSADLNDALQKLGSLPADSIQVYPLHLLT